MLGAALVLFGFVLAMCWDVYKGRREAARRDNALLYAAVAEVEAVKGTVLNDLNIVNSELKLLPSGHRLLNPLDPVEGGFWDAVKYNPPRALVRDERTLARVRDVARRTDQVNEMIRSREAFRVANPALSTMNDVLTDYDKLIARWLSELAEALNVLQPALEEARQMSPARHLLKQVKMIALQRPDV